MTGIEINKYKTLKTYIRNGKRCILDPIREKLIQLTPEEEIRQRIVKYLMSELYIPASQISVEVPMTHLQKGEKGRADIVVYGNNNGEKECLLVVECKAQHIDLTDRTVSQATTYREIMDASFMAVTNGGEIISWYWDAKGKTSRNLTHLPPYGDMLAKSNLTFDETEEPSWERPKYKQPYPKAAVKQFIDKDWLSKDTDPELVPFLVNIIGCLMDEKTRLSPHKYNDIKIVEDGGRRYTTFGNASGGSWTGDYRYFIIEDDAGNNQIISLSFMAGGYSDNEHTVLIAAIDDYELSHNSLQLNIDKYVRKEGSQYTIWHNGKMTVANLGPIKTAGFIEYIKKESPELIDDSGRIVLGQFDGSKEITWDSVEMVAFIDSMIEYALLRDKYRKVIKAR